MNKRDIVEDRRNRGGQRNLRIGNLQIFRDKKRRGPHHRRHDLSAGGSDRFDRRRHGRRIARLLHHRNRKRAVDDHVGHGAAADVAEQTRRDDGDLRLAAAKSSHQRQRKIAEKLGAADDVKHFAENNEDQNDADADLEGLAEDSVGIEIKIGRQPTDRPALP